MKFRNYFLLPCVAFFGVQSANLNADSEFNPNIANDGTATWDGQDGFIYFVQWSIDLVSWEYLPEIFHGSGVYTCQAQTADPDIYYRVSAINLPSANPDNDDFDDDGISNLTELMMDLDPLNADTDGDGFSDGVEVSLGTNPLLSDHALSWQGTAAVILTPTTTTP